MTGAGTKDPAAIVARIVPPADVAKTVWNLKVQGMDVDQICAVTRLTSQEVAEIVERKAQERRINVAQNFDTEAVLSLERLDAMMSAIWDRVIDGDLAAIKQFKDLDESRRKMLGLDADVVRRSLSPEAGQEMDMSALSAEELKVYAALTQKLTARPGALKKLPPKGGGR